MQCNLKQNFLRKHEINKDRLLFQVDTVKRLVIKKLPKVLAIQLKRFDYDWERESAIKFNDYFEFPREFDMEPYTVQGLAKIEGT